MGPNTLSIVIANLEGTTNRGRSAVWLVDDDREVKGKGDGRVKEREEVEDSEREKIGRREEKEIGDEMGKCTRVIGEQEESRRREQEQES